jgi:hypothetical protein
MRQTIENRIEDLEQKVENQSNEVAIAVRHADGTLTDVEGNPVDGTYTDICFELPPEIIEHWENPDEPFPWDILNDTSED